ncbi:hypothetical protein [Halorarum salinum]|uniref:Uncharacterized protein n=1 Tax=Halorarum salinum TaxID=2743089 RepID=A0A7D5L9H5_9EURY|nr:hypothetical protein [Halobaculum salinum]QLG61130.1 hypothetical protein HUG12_05025 [Halobaculum salinum]
MTFTGDYEDPITFVASADTIRVRDELETQQLDLTVPDHEGVERASTRRFPFPVDDAVGVTTRELAVGAHSSLHVRDERGEHLGELTSTPREFSRGTYYLDVQGSVKAYVRIVDASFTASYRSANLDYAPLDVAFDAPARIEVGARSIHGRPGATVTVPDDPDALLEALPALASSIKEFSPERSWPTLRGHPPAIERGERLHVPDGLSTPTTGVTVEVPATYADLYRVAPLVFYLGADVVAGRRRRLHLGNGYVEPLVRIRRSLEDRVAELLGRCLLFDSLVRIGGYYSLPRHEYDELAPRLPFYPPNLADASTSERLIEYFEVDADLLEPFLPGWPYVPTLRPDPADAELLPSLLDSLTPIRVADGADPEPSTGASPSSPDERSHVPAPVRATTAERAPEGAVRLLPEAFRNARRRTIVEPPDVRAAFLAATADRAERLREYVADARQSRLRAADVDVVAAADARAVERALETRPDLLYYEPAPGLGPDDLLDAVRSTGESPAVAAVGAPLDPAAEAALVEHGTVAGMTADRPLAVRELGRFASSLVVGVSVERSAALAELEPPFRFFGKPAHALVRRQHGVVTLEANVRSLSPDEHEVVRYAPVVETVPVGSVTRVRNENPEDTYHLVGNAVAQADVHSTEDVLALLADDDYVVRLNGEQYHGEREASADLVRESARRTLGRTRD